MLKTDHLTDTRALLDVAADRGAPSRRQALGLALGVGYAAATLPALAQSAIKTSSDGLTTGEVTIDVAGFKMPAFRAQPAGKTGLPVVLVLSEIFGVHEHRRRRAPPGARGLPGDRARAVRAPGRRAKLRRDGQADERGDRQGARRAGDGRPGRHRGLGRRQRRQHRQAGRDRFCWGGRQAWLYAEHNPG
jgi:carboxymethylenebutenolidase